MDFEHITGIILAGGKSSRFGEDKALYRYNGKPMVEYAIDVLGTICENILLITNKPDEYSKFNDIKLVHDKYLGCGPLGGIHAGLLESKNEDNLIVSCDMPEINSGLLSVLLMHRYGYQVVMPTHNGFGESFPCYFHKSAIPIIEEALKLKRFKISDAITPLLLKYLSVEEMPFYSEGLFANVNYKGDINCFKTSLSNGRFLSK
jgi:molybdopterin-guanine dinucleotide biosynthesis protein A